VARGISQRDLLGAVSLVAVSLALAWSPLAKADDRPALNADAPAAPAPARPEPVVVRAETFTKPAPDVALPLAESKLLGPADIPDNATPFAILLGVVSASLAAQLTRLNGRISELQREADGLEHALRRASSRADSAEHQLGNVRLERDEMQQLLSAEKAGLARRVTDLDKALTASRRDAEEARLEIWRRSANLQNVVARKEERAFALAASLDQCLWRIGELTDQVAKLEERSQSLSTSLSEEQTKSDTLEKARSAAIQDARDLLSVQRDLKFEIEELRERLLAREAELESLAAQLGAAQARVRDLETRAVNDTQTHAEMAAEWEKRLEEQEAASVDALEEMQTQLLADQEAKLAEAEERRVRELAEAEERFNTATVELEAAHKAELMQVEAAVAELEAHIELSQKENRITRNALKESISTAEAARDQARKEASELSASLERARAESTQLASRLRGAEVDRAETERKLHILQERLKLAEQSEQRLQDQALALEQTIENERASRVAIERARAASAADVKALRARERELTERVDAMELEKSVTMRQLQELKNKITELETVASDAATLRREVDSLRSRAVEVESEAEKRLEEELAEAREQLSQAKKHALEARTEAVKMVEEIELETQEKVTAAEERAERLQRDMEEERFKVERLNQSLTQATTSLDKEASEVKRLQQQVRQLKQELIASQAQLQGIKGENQGQPQGKGNKVKQATPALKSPANNGAKK